MRLLHSTLSSSLAATSDHFIKEGCEGRDRARLMVIHETHPGQRQQLLNSNTNWPMDGNPKDPVLKTEFFKKMAWSVG